GNGSHASTLKSPSYTKSVSWQHYRKKPIIYSGAVFYHTNLAGYFNEYPWWVAHYYQRRPDNDGMAWRFWQHSDRGQVDGINGPVDFNVFNGTVEELQAFVDGIKETP
ncbi:GH25 family lysozyme, partial [Escherichia coli]